MCLNTESTVEAFIAKATQDKTISKRIIATTLITPVSDFL
jgi:hypothetical protein